jgi:Na+/H+ antiporter NhaD/arsenite permease-like protein
MTALIVILFVVGYVLITLEHPLRLNKAASALLTAALCWSVYAVMNGNTKTVTGELGHHLADISAILFFLLGAMLIVELIDAHDGFEIVSQKIATGSKKKLVWIIGFLSFFLSAVLDNLTTTIVMVTLLRKLIPERKERLLLVGLVVIAANAGGAWSPIGDVTTTMLWIGKQVTTVNIILQTFLASLVCFVVPAFIISLQVKEVVFKKQEDLPVVETRSRERNIVLVAGLLALLFVPVFKAITGLPPYMGILFGVGLMWVITEMIHSEKDEREKGLLSVNHALRKIDTPSILFFLGILLAVSALQSIGVLASMGDWLDRRVGNLNLISILTGFLSAVVDNVPLVAAAQGTYSLERFPTDHSFWEFLAYCAGTGGSILIIGSAAGVAAMGMEKIDFFWYLKKIGWLALLGYLAGAGVFILQHFLTQ